MALGLRRDYYLLATGPMFTLFRRLAILHPTGTLERGSWRQSLLALVDRRHDRRMFRLVLYPFKFRDRITGKWVRARHKLQVPALQRQYAEWEITGAPEIRDVTPGPIEHFNPFRLASPRVCIAPMLLYMR